MNSFKGKVVIVTGASKGIGTAIALAFAKQSAKIVLTGRDQEQLQSVKKQCENQGAAEVITIVADLQISQQIESIVEKTVKEFGRIDILVNNAGIVKRGKLQEATLEDFDLTFSTDVKSVFYLTKKAIPFIMESKGNVVNISSICSTNQYPGILLYNMAKAALDQFTKTIALELAPSGVRVNSVNPAAVKTGIYDKHWNEDQKKNYYDNAHKFHPLGRIPTVDDIAESVLFLASDSASMITGTCLMVDGGRILNCS